MDCNTREERALRLARAVKLVQAGDVNAYEEIYAVCDGTLRAFVGRRYGHMGGDFTDEVAIRTHEYAFSHLNHYSSDRGASFQTWLNWRSRRVSSQVLSEWFGGQAVQRNEGQHDLHMPTAAGPEGIREASERDRVLRQEFRALARSDRLSIAHHDLAGRTFSQTSERLGFTVGETRWSRRRGLKRLRARLRELGVRPVEVDSTPAPVWHGQDTTGYDDDWTAGVTAVLPDGPKTLTDAAAEPAAEEEDEQTH